MSAAFRDRASSKFSSLQAGRAFAALSVLLFHTTLILGMDKYLGDGVFDLFLQGNSGVEFFFVLSGFVIVLVHWNDERGFPALVNFAWRRVRRIYPLLWLVLTALLVIHVALPGIGPGHGIGVIDIVSHYLILPIGRSTLLAVEWTLRHEMVFYFLFSLTLLNRKIGLMFLFFYFLNSALAPFHLFGEGIDQVLAEFRISEYNLLFLMGGLSALVYLYRRDLPWPEGLLAAGTAVFFGTWGTLASGVVIAEHYATWLFGAGATCLVLGGACFESRRPLRLPKAVVFVGDASYAIYLVHLPVIVAAARVATYATESLGMPKELTFLLIAAAALMAGIVAHLVERRLLAALPTRVPVWRRTGRKPHDVSAVVTPAGHMS